VDEALRVACEMNERMWDRFEEAFTDLDAEEIRWRALPEANSIDLIVRHLRIEAEWHLRSLREGAPLPTVAAPAPKPAIDTVPLDFARNFPALKHLVALFIATLRETTLTTVRERTASAYGEALKNENRHYLLAYQQATHLALHLGQIRMIRNLYRKTRGLPARFRPDNPSFPT
jgi:Protein of unknown function (DUF664)